MSTLPSAQISLVGGGFHCLWGSRLGPLGSVVEEVLFSILEGWTEVLAACIADQKVGPSKRACPLFSVVCTATPSCKGKEPAALCIYSCRFNLMCFLSPSPQILGNPQNMTRQGSGNERGEGWKIPPPFLRVSVHPCPSHYSDASDWVGRNSSPPVKGLGWDWRGGFPRGPVCNGQQQRTHPNSAVMWRSKGLSRVWVKRRKRGLHNPDLGRWKCWVNKLCSSRDCNLGSSPGLYRVVASSACITAALNINVPAQGTA